MVEGVWQGLSELGYEIVSTGGSASAIEAAGVPVQRVEELTGFPEMLDGTATRNIPVPLELVWVVLQCMEA